MWTQSLVFCNSRKSTQLYAKQIVDDSRSKGYVFVHQQSLPHLEAAAKDFSEDSDLNFCVRQVRRPAIFIGMTISLHSKCVFVQGSCIPSWGTTTQLSQSDRKVVPRWSSTGILIDSIEYDIPATTLFLFSHRHQAPRHSVIR